ncbi:hypothetical protein M2282_003275 [Variovorax boronicumulans]|uniref:hypothetical protein n=1 Tax=Variovorax boronicumulans TaxID=436515 RepID=UPI0024772B36|nr:hypothetical protein [Variovorax boronicumulans]MDH6168124.1 hypothetical protein [Variovorax boronicumulans]
MPSDLVFDRPPLTGSPVELVFGDDVATPSDAVYATGRIALPSFIVLGAATVKRPPTATAGGSIALPAFMLTGTLRYDSAVERPLVGRARAQWQLAASVQSPVSAELQAVQPVRATSRAKWQRAAPVAGRAALAWQDVQATRVVAGMRHQDALRVGAAADARFQDVQRVRTGGVSRWQEAVRVLPAAWSMRHQDANRLRAAAQARWQEAVKRDLLREEPARAAGLTAAGTRSRWQEFMRPLPGVSIVVPPAQEPCYLPSTALVFAEGPLATGVLVFVCERHTTPPGGEIITVPIRRAYIVQNSISLVRIDSGEVIEASAFSMSLDADSWTWRWSATLPGAAWPVIRRGIHAAPVEILATVNGVPYRLAATDCNRDRRFGDARVQVQGKGRAAMLDDPYAPILNHASASARSVAQLLDLALTYNGVGIGWDIDFGLTDWTVPGGTWSFQGSYIGAVLDIASAAGAIVQPHATDATLRVMPRYPAAPWNWDTLTPNFVLPAAAVSIEGIQPLKKPDYNRVFVAGANAAGVLGQITRSGTAGDSVAPMVTHALATHSDAAAQRGLAVLSDTGAQASVSLRLQVLPETGLILPGALVRYEDGAETHLGLVRSTSVDWQRPVLRQSITLETHVEV